MEVSKLSASLGSMGAVVAGSDSPTTRLASRHLDTAISWSSAPDTRPTTLLAQTTTSPSPPLTTQSASPVTSATTSPQHMPQYELNHPKHAINSSSPVAVRAAVHRADTGTTIIRTTTTVRTPSSHKSEGSLDQFDNYYPSQTQSQNDLGLTTQQINSINAPSPEYTYKSVTMLPKRQLWQRSASCRDLYDFSFEETGQAKRRAKPPKPIEKNMVSLEERKLESPITRYDDHRAIYSASSRDSSLEIHQDIMMPDQKVYSSSYPGTTTYSQESVEDPGNYDLRDSQDDLSHDSYELIEKSDDDYSTSGDYKYTKKSKPLNTRSCSLDSGNYLPSDSDSDGERRIKCKSSSDVHQDIFMMDDPRDLPREIIPRKSDGSFYKTFKATSRTSSQESKSDYYDSKTTTKSSRESLRKTKFGSRGSSQESNPDIIKKPKKNKSSESLGKKSYYDSRTSSLESKSEYYDANSKVDDKYISYKKSYDRKIEFERNYGTQKRPENNFELNKNYEINENFDYSYNGMKESSHVHSISLQNVETEQHIRINRNLEQNTVPRVQKSNQHRQVDNKQKTTHIWPENIAGLPTEIESWSKKQEQQRSTESESNIFSFDEDKIQSLQESSDLDGSFGVVPDLDNVKKPEAKRRNYRDVFMEIEPRICHDLPLHQPIERTKSDPNSLARQRLNSSSRRLLLMHQKSIDLTPAESSDEDYLYKQIPSAPPITKYKGMHFEMPTAEFGHFDILKREVEGEKTKFEVPKSQFEVLGAKTQSDFVNLPPKDEDIPYILHKRHIMNGTAQKDEIRKHDKETRKPEKETIRKKPEPPPRKSSELTRKPPEHAESEDLKLKSSKKEPETSFLFTQNIDLSKVDPVTLEVDKSVAPVQHLSSPKRDITHIDPILLEALSSKLSQIESDSPTSSKTESLKHKIFVMQSDRQMKKDLKVTLEEPIPPPKLEEKKEPPVEEQKPKEKPKTDVKKRVIKPRMQPGKKSGKTTKTKVRITSFSSDDESLDSDDVFGSAEATPTRIEFSPPQMRKEMESILKFESERKYLQYTMSSTEVEGSPPQTRKKTDKSADNGLDPNIQPELRRISERSFSIPSSEDDFNIKTTDLQPVFADVLTIQEIDKEEGEKSMDETLKEDSVTDKEQSTLDEEREREKLLLQAEIENDIKNLQVPPKTKITEITSPTISKKSQSPLLFAHARLNLSEGSAFTLLQKQQALESPIAGRRAKSLDAPIIPINRLPPLNAFSSKDDTVEEEDHHQREISDVTTSATDKSTEEKSDVDDEKVVRKKETPKKLIKKPVVPQKPQKDENKSKIDKERDQIVPDVTTKSKRPVKSTVQTKTTMQKNQKMSKPTIKSTKTTKSDSKVTKPPKTVPKSASTESKKVTEAKKSEKPLPSQSSLPTQSSLTLPEIKRAKSQEIESTKKIPPKEKAKSLEKLELKRLGSKERTKSEDSDTDVAKRKEKQQSLYEIAIKQTLKSPVKDTLPVFPQVEEMVRERHGKLEISINTIEPSVPLEEAVIITKSPKKLDKTMDTKLTKSLELNLTGDDDEDSKPIQRLGKSLDLEIQKKNDKYTEFDFKPEAILSKKMEDEIYETSPENDAVQETVTADIHDVPESETDKVILEGTSLDVWLSVDDAKNQKIENITVIQKSGDFFEQRESAKPPDLARIDAKSSSDSQSIEKISLGNSLDIKYIDDSAADSSQKSEQDAHLIAEMQKASNTVSKFIKRN